MMKVSEQISNRERVNTEELKKTDLGRKLAILIEDLIDDDASDEERQKVLRAALEYDAVNYGSEWGESVRESWLGREDRRSESLHPDAVAECERGVIGFLGLDVEADADLIRLASREAQRVWGESR